MDHFSKKDLLEAIDKCREREQDLFSFKQGNILHILNTRPQNPNSFTI